MSHLICWTASPFYSFMSGFGMLFVTFSYSMSAEWNGKIGSCSLAGSWSLLAPQPCWRKHLGGGWPISCFWHPLVQWGGWAGILPQTVISLPGWTEPAYRLWASVCGWAGEPFGFLTPGLFSSLEVAKRSMELVRTPLPFLSWSWGVWQQHSFSWLQPWLGVPLPCEGWVWCYWGKGPLRGWSWIPP